MNTQRPCIAITTLMPRGVAVQLFPVTMVAPSRVIPLDEYRATHCADTNDANQCARCVYDARLDGLRLYIRDRS